MSFFPTTNMNPKPVAAPFPKLPGKKEIQEEINRVNHEIYDLKIHLSLFEKQLHRKDEVFEDKKDIPDKNFGIAFYRGCNIDDNLLKKFVIDNKKYIDQSHNKSKIECDAKYQKILDLPQYIDNLETQDENLSVMYSLIYGYQHMKKSKQEALCKKFINYQHIKNEYLDPAIDSLNLIHHNDQTFWGNEQDLHSTVPFEGDAAVVGCSHDVEQIISDDDLFSKYYTFHDNNLFISDPVKEHDKFRKRMNWSNADKELFYQLFAKLPHKFSKIAEHFPQRTTKDMIEFYYRTKTSVEFQSARAASMNIKFHSGRGKRKVITEGTIKRK